MWERFIEHCKRLRRTISSIYIWTRCIYQWHELLALIHTYVSTFQDDFATDCQSTSSSWCREPLWSPWPDFSFILVCQLPASLYRAPSLTRALVFSLHWNHSLVIVAQDPLPYIIFAFETTPTWRTRFPYWYSTGTGWPNNTSRHLFPFLSLLTTRRATVEIF
jgi:hypothetical protein